MALSDASVTLAGILVLSLVTVESGGAFMLKVVQGKQATTDLQKSFFRAGHAHAGVLLILALVVQPFVDATDLSGAGEWLARSGVPAAALIMPGGFFLSVLGRDVAKPNRLFVLIPIGAVLLAAGLIALGIGLLAV
jgi:hypothetical protein